MVYKRTIHKTVRVCSKFLLVSKWFEVDTMSGMIVTHRLSHIICHNRYVTIIWSGFREVTNKHFLTKFSNYQIWTLWWIGSSKLAFSQISTKKAYSSPRNIGRVHLMLCAIKTTDLEDSMIKLWYFFAKYIELTNYK